MNCRQIRSLLSEYYDRASGERLQKIVREHLMRCQECDAEYEKLKKSLAILRKLKSQKAPRDYLQNAFNGKKA
jgi:predicted anti-sigma-YlaC factor YlaD